MKKKKTKKVQPKFKLPEMPITDKITLTMGISLIIISGPVLVAGLTMLALVL